MRVHICICICVYIYNIYIYTHSINVLIIYHDPSSWHKVICQGFSVPFFSRVANSVPSAYVFLGVLNGPRNVVQSFSLIKFILYYPIPPVTGSLTMEAATGSRRILSAVYIFIIFCFELFLCFILSALLLLHSPFGAICFLFDLVLWFIWIV